MSRTLRVRPLRGTIYMRDYSLSLNRPSALAAYD